MRILPLCLLGAITLCAADFESEVKPVLSANCAPCHNPANARNRINFLKAENESDISDRRSLWRNVSTQLRNRTMPPGNHKLSEADRLRVSNWIDEKLRNSACTTGAYAGYVPPRRLNRREYKNTIRDLFGLDLHIPDLFPADEAGGAGFDTNGDTLYLPPMLLERYMEAARVVADRVIAAPAMNRVYLSYELEPKQTPPPPTAIRPTRVLQPGEELRLRVAAYAPGPYNLRVSVERPRVTPFSFEVLNDGEVLGKMSFARDSAGGATARTVVAEWGRGGHEVTIRNGSEKIDFYSLTVEQKLDLPTAEKKSLHYRLLGVEAGETPVEPRNVARRMLTKLLPRAYRQPVEAAEVEKFMALYDRSAQRGEPFEESLKLALRAVLVSPRFLFRVDDSDPKPGIRPLGAYALASRLSYFLWATMPDEELLSLAAGGKLNDPAVLRAQVDRMLDDPRSRNFANAFVGQWLGTQEIGGRAVPLLTELQHFYTPEIAADLREQPALMFHHMITADRNLLDLLDGNYTFLTERLVRYYQLEGKVAPLPSPGFHKVEWPDRERGGVLGLASVLAMTSHYKQASPVLRGAWVLDTILGTPVPPPPDNVPALEEAGKGRGKKLTVREMLEMHRANQACATCHNIMDPVGLALEHFDWMGRWRDKEDDGQPVNAKAKLASGEEFDGAIQLRQFLMSRKEDFARHLTGKLLGYALGRGLEDGDQCTIDGMVKAMAANNYSTRAWIREIVLSTPFRMTQGDAQVSEQRAPTKKAPKRLLGTK